MTTLSCDLVSKAWHIFLSGNLGVYISQVIVDKKQCSDAEIVSCLRSCQFQLVREQLSPIPRLWLVTLSHLLIGHLLQIPASHWLRACPPCGHNQSLSHEYIITWRQTTQYYAVWPPRVRQSWWGLGNYFEPSSLSDTEMREYAELGSDDESLQDWHCQKGLQMIVQMIKKCFKQETTHELST